MMSAKEKYCKECGKLISEKRVELIPDVEYCVKCQRLRGDTFRYKMKTVGFGDAPKIAKTEKDWKLLKRQRKVKDI